MDNKAFHEKIGDFLKEGDKSESKKAKEEFLKVCTYLPGAYDEDEAFKNLNTEIEKIEKEGSSKTTNRLFYMALPPNVFTVVAGGLKRNCYVEDGNNRIVIEKPFGKDLESSREMMGELKKLWKEEETFREWAGTEVKRRDLHTD
jgi:glucose-6-phosphate 1-dehydrogenase